MSVLFCLYTRLTLHESSLPSAFSGFGVKALDPCHRCGSPVAHTTVRSSRTLNIRFLCLAPANASSAYKCFCLSPVGPGTLRNEGATLAVCQLSQQALRASSYLPPLHDARAANPPAAAPLTSPFKASLTETQAVKERARFPCCSSVSDFTLFFATACCAACCHTRTIPNEFVHFSCRRWLQFFVPVVPFGNLKKIDIGTRLPKIDDHSALHPGSLPSSLTEISRTRQSGDTAELELVHLVV